MLRRHILMLACLTMSVNLAVALSWTSLKQDSTLDADINKIFTAVIKKFVFWAARVTIIFKKYNAALTVVISSSLQVDLRWDTCKYREIYYLSKGIQFSSESASNITFTGSYKEVYKFDKHTKVKSLILFHIMNHYCDSWYCTEQQ